MEETNTNSLTEFLFIPIWLTCIMDNLQESNRDKGKTLSNSEIPHPFMRTTAFNQT